MEAFLPSGVPRPLEHAAAPAVGKSEGGLGFRDPKP